MHQSYSITFNHNFENHIVARIKCDCYTVQDIVNSAPNIFEVIYYFVTMVYVETNVCDYLLAVIKQLFSVATFVCEVVISLVLVSNYHDSLFIP